MAFVIDHFIASTDHYGVVTTSEDLNDASLLIDCPGLYAKEISNPISDDFVGVRNPAEPNDPCRFLFSTGTITSTIAKLPRIYTEWPPEVAIFSVYLQYLSF